jgi:hypothetical protein
LERLHLHEHNFGAQRERIHDLMASHGYQVVEAKWDTWFWREDEIRLVE